MNKVKCQKCGYEWIYKGKLKRSTCPNCGSKTSTVEPEEALEATLETSEPEDQTTKMLRKYLES
jgi:Zn finger protein HypA/HybF involved in hydrogenase expression